MNLFEYISDRASKLWLEAYLHTSLVVQCTILAAVLGVLIGVAVYRSPIGAALATALASTILTVPSFALLGLLIPISGTLIAAALLGERLDQIQLGGAGLILLGIAAATLPSRRVQAAEVPA